MEEEPARPAAPAAPTTSEGPQATDEPAPAVDDASAPTEGAGRRRRRGRTALLVTVAAVLGLVAGTCGGYLVQAERRPTKLPSLAQPLSPPAADKAPKPLSAAEDRRVRTDGDLRKLLLKKPRGARDAEWLEGSDGWMDLASYAERYRKTGEKFSQYIQDEFRRAAVVGWGVGDSYNVEIHLIQFHQEEVLAAVEASDAGRDWAGWAWDTSRWPIPGTGDGEVFVRNQPEPETGYGQEVYVAEAYAWRGDIQMAILISGTKRVSKKLIADLAKRQMERL
ncbi:hypothetical protein ACIGO6_16050 [Streptomyces sp. NPDC053750]|uniref:hypothetical protein n=1 Tax=Streptomyces sp. NPDC053750 TaxID=3365714 RepID=UPI0037D6851B